MLDHKGLQDFYDILVFGNNWLCRYVNARHSTFPRPVEAASYHRVRLSRLCREQHGSPCKSSCARRRWPSASRARSQGRVIQFGFVLPNGTGCCIAGFYTTPSSDHVRASVTPSFCESLATNYEASPSEPSAWHSARYDLRPILYLRSHQLISAL